jgi:hypothetical protein
MSKNQLETRTRRPLKRLVKRHFRRCNWMMQSKGWKDCGRKATWHARGIGAYYCDQHQSHVCGAVYDKVPLNPELRRGEKD